MCDYRKGETKKRKMPHLRTTGDTDFEAMRKMEEKCLELGLPSMNTLNIAKVLRLEAELATRFQNKAAARTNGKKVFHMKFTGRRNSTRSEVKIEPGLATYSPSAARKPKPKLPKTRTLENIAVKPEPDLQVPIRRPKVSANPKRKSFTKPATFDFFPRRVEQPLKLPSPRVRPKLVEHEDMPLVPILCPMLDEIETGPCATTAASKLRSSTPERSLFRPLPLSRPVSPNVTSKARIPMSLDLDERFDCWDSLGLSENWPILE